MVRHTFLAASSTPTINLRLNEVLYNVIRIQISWVQCPPIATNFDDFLYIVENNPLGQLESNGSSNIGGMAANPPRCFLTLPQASQTVTTTYNYGQYFVDKTYSNPFTLQEINLQVVDRNNVPVTFVPASPDLGIFFVVTTRD